MKRNWKKMISREEMDIARLRAYYRWRLGYYPPKDFIKDVFRGSLLKCLLKRRK